jgi:protein-S-isoprenylcysteine O-methyltransferase Ste14
MSPAQTTYSRIARRVRVPLGFVLAGAYIWLARPTWASILVGLAAATPGIALRALASGHVKKNTELTTTGPYRFTRNPLYLGSIIIGIGFGIASRSWWIALAIVLLFLAIYIPVIRSEEAYLRSQFPEFDEFARRVPRLFPRLWPAAGVGVGGFSMDLYRKHREYNAILGAVGMMGVLVLKVLFFSH